MGRFTVFFGASRLFGVFMRTDGIRMTPKSGIDHLTAQGSGLDGLEPHRVKDFQRRAYRGAILRLCCG